MSSPSPVPPARPSAPYATGALSGFPRSQKPDRLALRGTMHPRTSLAGGNSAVRCNRRPQWIGWSLRKSGQKHPRPTGFFGWSCEARWRLLRCVLAGSKGVLQASDDSNALGSRKGAKAQSGTQRNAAGSRRVPRLPMALWMCGNGGTMQPPPSVVLSWAADAWSVCAARHDASSHFLDFGDSAVRWRLLRCVEGVPVGCLAAGPGLLLVNSQPGVS